MLRNRRLRRAALSLADLRRDRGRLGVWLEASDYDRARRREAKLARRIERLGGDPSAVSTGGSVDFARLTGEADA
jgi:hypothetical protein